MISHPWQITHHSHHSGGTPVVEVKKACIQQYDNIVCSIIILETLTCTLLPENQDWQVTHIGRETILKALNNFTQMRTCPLYCSRVDRRVYGKSTLWGTLAQSAVPSLRWGLVVLLERYQDPCRCWQNIIDTASCLPSLHLEQVFKISHFEQQTAAMLLYERDVDNDSGAGFPRSDGRLPYLPEPTLRDANRDFSGSSATEPLKGHAVNFLDQSCNFFFSDMCRKFLSDMCCNFFSDMCCKFFQTGTENFSDRCCKFFQTGAVNFFRPVLSFFSDQLCNFFRPVLWIISKHASAAIISLLRLDMAVLLILLFALVESSFAVFPPYFPATNQNVGRDDLIVQYFDLGFTYKEIFAFLVLLHGFQLGLRQLKMVLRGRALGRRRNSSDLIDVVNAIEHELMGSGGNLGYRSMSQRLASEYGLSVHKETVRHLLQIVKDLDITCSADNTGREDPTSYGTLMDTIS